MAVQNAGRQMRTDRYGKEVCGEKPYASSSCFGGC